MSQDDYNPRNYEKTEDEHTPLPPAGDEQAVKFLHALDYDVGNPNGLEIRLIGEQGKPRIERTFNWRGICRANQVGDNVYFGVAHRDGNGGKAENVTHATAVWADIDGKDWNTANPEVGKHAALDHLTKLLSAELKPSIIVDTGHGYHVYWLLSEPYKFTSDEERWRFKRVLDGISSVLKGDKSANDIARILRLPGTLNTKNEERRECSIIYWQPERKHIFTEIEGSITNQTVEDILKKGIYRVADFTRDLTIAIKSLPLLKPERVNDYEQWLEVGMALHSISDVPEERDVTFALWENWSRGVRSTSPESASRSGTPS